MADKIDISKLKTNFGKNDERKDEYLMALLEKAYTGKVLCRKAIIKMEAIKPSTDYKPDISEEYRNYFLKREKDGPPFIFVYQRDDKFMMSDDYNAYHMYKELNYKIVPCVVLGDIDDAKDVVEFGGTFQLESPAIQVI